ncbi:MAG: SDR family oxidoreductase [Pseudomonadota bacterium]
MNSAIQTLEPGRVVLVTAGAAGIGRCIAETFIQAGARVHVCDLDADVLQAFLDANPGARGTCADIAQREDVERLFAEITTSYGRLDVLINNAGIAGPTAAVEDIDDEDWDQTVAVDLNGQFYVTKRAVPLLKEAGAAAIVNIASNAAFFGFPLRSPYTACKWAMIGLTKTWAMELGPHGVRVNAICPGSVAGERIDTVIAREAVSRGVPAAAVREVYTSQSSLRRFCDPEDVANLALFLASPLGGNLSGQAIGVDGHTESLSSYI